MFTLTLNDVLSIIGAITGVTAMLLSFYVLNKESLKIKVKHPTDDAKSSMVGFDIEYSGTDDFGGPIPVYSKYMILIWLQISSSSKSPTTILEMSLSIDGNSERITSSRNQSDFCIASRYHFNNDNEICVDGSYSYKSIELPIFLPPYSVVEGHFNFNKLILDENTTVKAILRVKTTQGSKKFKIILNPKFPEVRIVLS